MSANSYTSSSNPKSSETLNGFLTTVDFNS
jgi:hypothetical protein